MLAARELAVPEWPAAADRRRAATRARRVARARSVGLSRTACAGLLALAVLCAFLVAYRHTALTQMGYQAEGLSGQLAMLKKANGEREVTVAQLGNLARVEELATTQVGMVRPDETVTIASLGRSGSTVVAGGGEGTALTAGTTGAGQAGEAGEAPSEGGLLGRVWTFLKRLARNTVEAARSGS